MSGSPEIRSKESSRVMVRGLSKVFGAGEAGDEVTAVDHVDLEVGRGEFITIVGPSGCGKSTLLNIIAGLEQPSSGEILIEGAAAADRRRFFGYMFQKDLLFPWRTIRDNVAIGLEVQHVSRREARIRAGAILERFGLGGFAAKYPAQLSGGMRQRVALMRTLICDREVLLLDEPFGALDAMTRGVMQEWLLGIWEADHRTILFITHDIEEAIFLSDRVVMMSARPGRIKGQIDIGLDRPRHRGIVTAPEFTRLKKEILEQMYEESLIAAAT
jgi:ABC-type nitrate/sulfonate/bicarbonate transport system ATPase subunit